MKKRVIFLLMLLTFIPFIIRADEDIRIESIDVIDKSNDAVEIEKASFDGTNININVRMFKVEDFIKYKLVVNNLSDEKYKFDSDSALLSDDYVTYQLESDNDNYIKPKTNKIFYLTIKYKNNIDTSQYNSNYEYVANKNVSINLLKDEIVNPKTGEGNLMLVLIFVIGICYLILYFINKKEVAKLFSLLIIILLIIPIYIYATKTINLNVSSRVEIIAPNAPNIYVDNKVINLQTVKERLIGICINEIEYSESDIFKFEATSENSADVHIGYYDNNNNFEGIETSVSIETDAETGDSRVVVGEATQRGNINIIIPACDGKEKCNAGASIRELLESLDMECIKKLISNNKQETQA